MRCCRTASPSRSRSSWTSARTRASGWVATLSHARRKGSRAGYSRGALKRGEQRGQTSTTLWASAMGANVYDRLGYRTLGHLHLWENRP